jgi:hypothetical protein
MQNTFTPNTSSSCAHIRSGGARGPAIIALGCLLLSFAGSCKLTKAAVQAPGKLADTVLPHHESDEPRVPVSVVQERVRRFADSFAAQIAQATGEFARAADTPQARMQALGWSIWQRSQAFTIASGENPNRNMLDMLVFITLGRMVHEEYWGPKVWHEADQPMIDALRAAEEDIWTIASKVLTPKQEEHVRTTLAKWREENPDAVLTGAVRMPEFQQMLVVHDEQSTNILADFGELLNFDPLSGLEPATREVKQARLLGERTLYYAQRAQLVIPTQLELLSMKLTNQPDVQTTIEAADRVSKAAESLSETAKTLPDKLSEELTAQREGIVGDLEKVQGPASDLMKQAQSTLDAGKEMSTALQSAIATLDGFVANVRGPESDSSVIEASAPIGPEPKGKGFDVTEYGAAAEHVAVAATNLNTLLASVDSDLPRLQKTLDEVAQRGDATIDRAYSRGLRLGLILIGVAAAAALLVRWLSRGWRARAA